ncbi:hypothetical protein FS749_004825 [Ceratobasidium sp. UAMH 11750]|nr:hypothetical protein FS749_004825 [Ceratobasidium sp. UAMH 11750]
MAAAPYQRATAMALAANPAAAPPSAKGTVPATTTATLPKENPATTAPDKGQILRPVSLSSPQEQGP